MRVFRHDARGRAGHTLERRAFVLVAVLVIILLTSMIVISLLFRLKAEQTAGAAGAMGEQAWAAAMSGVEEALRVVGQIKPGDLEWVDEPRLLQARLVASDGADRWYFTFYSPSDPDSLSEVRYGLTDEASKLNVNIATRTNLQRLPSMPPELVASLFGLTNSEPAPGLDTGLGVLGTNDVPSGADAARLGPLATLEELLRVPGLTPALLFGEDANLNFRLDVNEDDGNGLFPPDNSDGKLELGLRQYLTVWSSDRNEINGGGRRTNLNDPAAALPEVSLPEALTNYIYALRSNHITLTHAAELLEAKGTFKDAEGKPVALESGVGKEELAQVLDLFTTTADEQVPGLININTASARVLATLPEIDDALAESMVSTRRGLVVEKRTTPAWLYSEGVVDAALFKKLAPRLTARSRQFSFHVVGYAVPSGRFRAFEVVVDTATGRPVVSYLRELTRLGLPFKFETLTEGPNG